MNKELEKKHLKDDFPVSAKFISLNYTEFKEKFNIEGTIKQIINDIPEDVAITTETTRNDKTKYYLNKIVKENSELVWYDCYLGVH